MRGLRMKSRGSDVAGYGDPKNGGYTFRRSRPCGWSVCHVGNILVHALPRVISWQALGIALNTNLLSSKSPDAGAIAIIFLSLNYNQFFFLLPLLATFKRQPWPLWLLLLPSLFHYLYAQLLRSTPKRYVSVSFEYFLRCFLDELIWVLAKCRGKCGWSGWLVSWVVGLVVVLTSRACSPSKKVKLRLILIFWIPNQSREQYSLVGLL